MLMLAMQPHADLHLPWAHPPRLAIMNQMKASDELTDEQVRQLTFDMESAHNAFFRSLAA
jgi:hypothetical protein